MSTEKSYRFEVESDRYLIAVFEPEPGEMVDPYYWQILYIKRK